DLGTNLLNGPYAKTPAGQIFADVKKSRDPFLVTFSDFTNYPPSYGKPAIFVGTTVFDGDELIAALIFQLSNERIDKIMTANRNWKAVGMGETGETYLVGQDEKFRSSPRFFLQNHRAYLASLRGSGMAADTLKAIEAAGTPVLLQPVDTPGARAALAGRKGFGTYKDYRGISVVSAYQPIRFGLFDWGLLAEIDEAELFSGVGRLTRNLLLLAAVLIPAVVFLTLKMERAFVRPIRHLLDATRKISAGDYSLQIPVTTDDEFGDLATAFNTMSETLEQREVSLNEQAEEHQRLLLSILPGSAVSQFQQGATSMAETHANVSVLFAEIEGWNELSHSLPAQESIQLLAELTSALEASGERFGVEKLQGGGNRYLAVSGIRRPRSDHEQRAVACALELLQVLQAFNKAHQCELSLSIGVHAGPLTTGVVKGQRLSYDIWGNTITIAVGLHEASRQSGIQVSAPIVDALRGLYVFQPLPPISVKGLGEMPAWSLLRPQDG
ncbi:MAG: adenylate/guanylate cyclase domain-containing protein, partial [Cyanobium sp.]